jgi:predicted DNA repair protein MutK
VAGSSLLVLLDDISLVLDDVAAMSKVAAKKTAGVLGDDLALNAEQVAGIRAERELPVVWAVAKGSFVNKVILVPAALAISATVPAAVTPLLMLGGAYLCLEGFEKVLHALIGGHEAEDDAHHQALTQAVANPEVDLLAFERDKVKGAIRTDFILSAEIVTITLGTVASAPFTQQLMVLSGVSVLITVGVYGLVAAIVKLDDMGLYLVRQDEARGAQGWRHGLGRLLLATAPRLMKALTVLGTVAMFLVGGGIILHGLPAAHEPVHALGLAIEATLGAWSHAVWPVTLDAVAGVLAGGVALLAVKVGAPAVHAVKRLLGR